MITDAPEKVEISQLKALWKEAFGDPDSFIDAFFETAYAPERCRFLQVEGKLAAALYWLDCTVGDEKLAYLYAVATAKKFQGRGLCRQLMHETHRDLKALGYAGTVLVPGSQRLFRMYEKMGYQVCSHIRELECEAGAEKVRLCRLSQEEYAALRRALLPAGGAVQEGENLTYLEAQAQLYGGDGFCAALVQQGDHVQCMELLGGEKWAPGILAALGAKTGWFRLPGQDKPFAMYCPLNGGSAPSYFGLAFD